MEQQLYSLSKLFTERLYRIPDYQRGYAWTEKQLKDFWSDLIQLENGKNHYLGVLTLESVPRENYQEWVDDLWIIDSKSYSPYYIVDGQQRLTTVIILVQAIIESLNDGVKLNYDTPSVIRKKFIFDSKDEGISRSYIFGYERDNPSYEFLKTRIFREPSESSEIPQDTIYTYNLEAAKFYFGKKLENMSLTDKEIVYRKLTQNLLLNIYTISSDIDVFVAFETMNNRGKPLSYLELLKNRLIYLSTKFEVDESEKGKLRRSINDTWKSMYHYLGKNKNKPLDDDIFLSNHFLTYFGRVESKIDWMSEVGSIEQRISRKKNRGGYASYLLETKFTVKSILAAKEGCLSKENKDILDDDKTTLFKDGRGAISQEKLTIQDVYSYVKSLRSSVELWYKLLNPLDSDFSKDIKFWIDKLIRLSFRSETFSAAPLLMIFFQKEKNEEKKVRLLKILESIGFLDLLFQEYELRFYRPNTLDFTDLAIKLRADKITPDKVIRDLEEIRLESLSDSDFWKKIKICFNTKGFYGWAGIRYFLYEYDLDLQSRSKTERLKLDWEKCSRWDYETIEHIYPQNTKKDCWTSKFTHYSTSQRSTLKHSLGNLLLLSRPKNSSFSNRCFHDKVSNDQNTVGYRYGSYSENEITKYSDWTAKEILERGVKLLDFMEKRWGLTLGGRNEKIEFLNLQFVVELEKL